MDLWLCLFLVVILVVVLVLCGNDVVRSEASFAAAVNDDDEGPSSPRVRLFLITTVHAIRRTMTSSISLEATVPGARFPVRSFDLPRFGPMVWLKVVLAVVVLWLFFGWFFFLGFFVA